MRPMSRKNQQLSPAQTKVLSWIGDGCPDNVMTDFTYKTTSYVLRDRGLITVSKKGGVWHAALTDAGRTLLGNPDALPLRAMAVPRKTTGSPRSPTMSRITKAQPALPTSELDRPARSAPATKRPSVLEQLIADVIAAGGALEVVEGSGQPNRQARVSAAIRAGKVPAGKLLTLSYEPHRHGKRVIRLEDPPAWMTAELKPITVRESLRSPQPVVAKLRSDDMVLPMKPPVRNRALRLLDAVARESARRGYEPRIPDRDRWNQTPQPKGVLLITIHGHVIGLTVTEQRDKVPHVPTASELRDAARYSFMRIRTSDQVPNGRLEIVVTNGQQYRQSAWRDGERTQIEDCLAQILQEMELRADHFEQLRQAEVLRRETAKRDWEAAFEKARGRMEEAHRSSVLTEQLERWQSCAQLDSYIQAMTAAVRVMNDESKRAAAKDWISWTRSYRSKLDPLSQELRIPAAPRPTPENMKPFLGNLSFYGPSGW